MRKLFKKSLACVLAVALCLTAMVGAMVVSADDIINGTIAFEDVTIKCTDTDATIPVTFSITSETDLINVAYLNVAVEGAAITGITAGEDAYDVVPNADLSVFEVWFDDNGDSGALAATANIAVSFTAGASFTVTVSDNTSASNNEQIIEFGTSDKTYTVTAHDGTATTTTTEEVTKDATCTEAGSKTVTVTCDACGGVVSTTTEEIPATDHAWGEGVVTTAPDCDDAGVRTYTCANDPSHTKTEAIDALGHTEVEIPAVDATCTTAGSTAGVKCSVCDAVITAPEAVEALGHNYAYTDNGDGTHSATCANGCEGITNEAHTYTDGTCICGAVEVVDCEGNHTYTSVKENVTDTTFDSVTYCSACDLEIARYTIDIPQGATLDENIAPSGHTTSVGETVGIGFRAKLSSLPAADNYKLYVVRHNNAGSYMFGTTSETLDQAGKSTANDFVAFKTYYGIELYSFTVPVTYMVLCYDAEGNVTAYSNPFTTTVEEICENYHNLSTTGDAAKTLHADLINLAAATQEYFVYRNSSSDYATKLVMPSFDSAYASTEISGALAGYDSTSGVELTVTTAIGQNPYFNIRFSGDIANKANYSMKVSFYNKIKKDTIVTEIDGSTFKGNATMINGTFEALPLYAGDSDVTIELYENGNDTPIGVRHFCLDTHISTYLSDNAGSTNQTTILLMNIWDAAAKYGQAHRALRNIPYVPGA